jgi:hypothetical protein
VASGSRSTEELIAEQEAHIERSVRFLAVVRQALYSLGETVPEVETKLRSMHFYFVTGSDAAERSICRYLEFIFGAEVTTISAPQDCGCRSVMFHLARRGSRGLNTVIHPPAIREFLRQTTDCTEGHTTLAGIGA